MKQNKPFLCPNCETELVLGPGTKVYETLCDHVSDPNSDSLPAREYYVCPNAACELHDKAFWDDWGDFYSSSDVHDWYHNNRLDSCDKRTFKNKGCEAINSGSRECQLDFIREAQGWRGLRNKISRRWGNWSCELRRLHMPGAYWRNNNTLWHRIGYSFGVWVMDPWGTHLWKWHRRSPDFATRQWLHHPYPWVRYAAKKLLQQHGIPVEA